MNTSTTVRTESNPTSREQLAAELFQFFEEMQIPYAVVGDTRTYHHKILSDIDIVVDPNALAVIGGRLKVFSAGKGFRIVQVLQHEQTAWYFVIAKTDKLGGVYYFQPDICSDYFRKGRLIITAEEILSGRCHKASGSAGRSFYIPAPAMAFIYYLIKKIDKGELTDRHGGYLSAEWKKDPEGVLLQLDRFWPQSDVRLLMYAAAGNDWSRVRTILPQLRKALHKRLSFSFWHRCREIMRKAQRVFHPTGLHVVFIGPDGSGKSTVLNRVGETLAPIFRRTRSYHLRPYFGSLRNDDAPNLNPHGGRPRDLLSSLAKLALWWADYTIGYAIAIFPRLVRSTLILFDRYYHDLSIDPLRYRYGGPITLARSFERCVPSPDLFVLLDAPAEVMQARKQEVPLEETARQRKRYLKFISRIKNGHVIDCALPLDMVVEQVNEVILSALENRVQQRLQRSVLYSQSQQSTFTVTKPYDSERPKRAGY